MILEIAVFNIQSAIFAAKAGADRIELCENAYDGGTTECIHRQEKILLQKWSL